MVKKNDNPIKLTAVKWANKKVRHYEMREKNSRKTFNRLLLALFITNIFIIAGMGLAIWALSSSANSLTIFEIIATTFAIMVIGFTIILNIIISIIRSTRKAKDWWRALDEIKVEVAKYRYRQGIYQDKNKISEENLLKNVKRIEKKYTIKTRKLKIRKILRQALIGGTDE